MFNDRMPTLVFKSVLSPGKYTVPRHSTCPLRAALILMSAFVFRGYDSCHNGNRFPRVYARVSDAYDWIRFIVCRESTNPPASFNCDGNVAEPPLPSPPSSPVAANPIKFRYIINTDGFPYENGKLS